MARKWSYCRLRELKLDSGETETEQTGWGGEGRGVQMLGATVSERRAIKAKKTIE
jgi:hypothetical protein